MGNTSSYFVPFTLFVAITVLYLLTQVWTIIIKPSLSPMTKLPGPKRSSFLWGSMKDIMRSVPGRWHLEQIKKYGKTFAYKGFMNTNRFSTVDARALGHILQRPDIYYKPQHIRFGLGRLVGEGLLFSEGADHRKQRKMLNPSFTMAQIRSFLPIFYDSADMVKETWIPRIPPSSSYAPSEAQPKGMVNVLDSMGHMALDIIGLTGFDYKFGSLEASGEGVESESELSAAFALVLNHYGSFGTWDIIVNWIPILHWVPTAKKRRIDHGVVALRRASQELVAHKKAAILEEMRMSEALSLNEKEKASLKAAQLTEAVDRNTIKGKDVMSNLIRANLAKDLPPAEKLTDEDCVAQITTFIIAGHETTATSLSWLIYCLSTHQDVQDQLREECLTTGPRPSLEVLEGLPYLDAVIREALRVNAIVPSTIRTCMQDDIIPFEDGSTLQMRKGDGIYVPIIALNMLPEYWGEDAEEFKPSRWLAPSTVSPNAKEIPGVYSHTMTFLGGPRSCIGYKFAVLEMKAVIHTLISTFVITKRPEDEIAQRTTIVTRPIVKGREKEGNQLPLEISLVAN